MLNLKSAIQSVLGDRQQLVRDVVVGSNSSFNYRLETDSHTAPFRVLQHEIETLQNRHEIEDKLTRAAILDLPKDGVGYVDSNRFAKCAPLNLQSENVLIPYARLLGWSAWMLELFYKVDASHFTRVEVGVPYSTLKPETLDLDQLKQELGDNPLKNFLDILLRNKFVIREDVLAKIQSITNAELKKQFDNKVVPPGWLDQLDQDVIQLMITDDREYLETIFEPAEVLHICFYLLDKLASFLLDNGFLAVVFVSHCCAAVLNDLGLAKDFLKIVQYPIECLRRIVLEFDCTQLRKRNLAFMKGSFLQKRQLYQIYNKIKNEDWVDLVHAISFDPHAADDVRLNEIYFLFLKAQKSTVYYYMVQFSVILEKNRMLPAKNPRLKMSSKAKLRNEIETIGQFFDAFRQFILITTKKTAFESRLSMEEINDFFNFNKLIHHKIIDLISTEDLLNSYKLTSEAFTNAAKL